MHVSGREYSNQYHFLFRYRDKLALEGPRRWVRTALAGQGG
jgi:ketosteroid isomerase-like protein